MCFWEKSISLVQERKKVVLSYHVVTKKYTEKVAWEQKLKESKGVILWSRRGRYFWAEGRTVNNCRHSEGWADLGIHSEIAKRPVGLESSEWEEMDPGGKDEDQFEMDIGFLSGNTPRVFSPKERKSVWLCSQRCLGIVSAYQSAWMDATKYNWMNFLRRPVLPQITASCFTKTQDSWSSVKLAAWMNHLNEFSGPLDWCPIINKWLTHWEGNHSLSR